jgi:hypothetical protein
MMTIERLFTPGYLERFQTNLLDICRLSLLCSIISSSLDGDGYRDDDRALIDGSSQSMQNSLIKIKSILKRKL